MASYYDYRPQQKRKQFNWTSAGQNALSTGLTTFATTGNPYLAGGAALVGGYLGGRSGPHQPAFDASAYNRAWQLYREGALSDLRQNIDAIGAQSGQRMATQGLYGSPLGQSVIQNNQNYALNQGLAGINQARYGHELNLANMQFQGQQQYDQQMADQYERLIGTIGMALPLAYDQWQTRQKQQQQLNNRFDALGKGTSRAPQSPPLQWYPEGAKHPTTRPTAPEQIATDVVTPGVAGLGRRSAAIHRNITVSPESAAEAQRRVTGGNPYNPDPNAAPAARPADWYAGKGVDPHYKPPKTPIQASTEAILGQEDADALGDIFGWDIFNFDTPSSPFLQNIDQLAPALPAPAPALPAPAEQRVQLPTQVVRPAPTPAEQPTVINPGVTMAHPNAPSHVTPPIEVTAQRPPFEPNRELAFDMEGSAPNVRMPAREVVEPRPQLPATVAPEPETRRRSIYNVNDQVSYNGKSYKVYYRLEDGRLVLRSVDHLGMTPVMARDITVNEQDVKPIGATEPSSRVQPNPASEWDPFAPTDPGSAYNADMAIDYIKFGEGPYISMTKPDPAENGGFNTGFGRNLTYNGLDVQSEIIPILRGQQNSELQIRRRLADAGIALNATGHVRLTPDQFKTLFPFGINEQVANFLLERDIKRSEQELVSIFGNSVYYGLTPTRQAVLLDMIHTMGIGNDKEGFLSFKNFIRMIKAGNFEAAAQEMQYVSPDNSKTLTDWYQQVRKRRAEPLITAMIKG